MAKKLKLTLITLILVFSMAGSAHAATLTYNTSLPIPTTLTDWTLSLPFSQFNPDLGTLNWVDLVVSGSFDTAITVTNNSGSASSGDVFTKYKLYINNNDYAYLAPSNNIGNALKTVNSDEQSFSLAGGGSITYDLWNGTYNYDSGQESNAALLALFMGTGTATVPFNTLTQTVLAYSGGNTSASQVGHSSLTGSITYDYTPMAAVPEPATMLLLGTGLIGLAGVHRKYRKK